MPVIGLGLHFLFAILFAIHAVRHGHDRYWLFVLFMFPVLGSLVYAGAIWLPGLRHDRHAQRIVHGIRTRLDPGRELREAREAFEHSATVENRLRLADALAAAGRHAEAVDAFRAGLHGVHCDDPAIQVRLAAALLESGRPGETVTLLDEVIRRHPSFRSADGHLLVARALAADGQRDRAREEFDVLIGYYAGYEARARYADALADWGDTDAALRLATESLRDARRLPKFARRANQAWLDRLARYASGDSAAHGAPRVE